MRRTLPILLVLCLAVLAVQPAVAGDPSARQIERMTRQLDRLVERLIGSIDAQDVTFKRLGRGYYSLSYPLAAKKPTGLNLRADDKPLRTLSCGHMILEPVTPSSVTTAVVSNIDTGYNLWWAAVNQGERVIHLARSLRPGAGARFDDQAAAEGIVSHHGGRAGRLL